MNIIVVISTGGTIAMKKGSNEEEALFSAGYNLDQIKHEFEKNFYL